MKWWMWVLMAGMLTGCNSTRMDAAMFGGDGASYGVPLMADSPIEEATDAVQPEQMLIWTGSMTMEVLSITNAADRIVARVKEADGYVESSEQQSNGRRPSMRLKLRIPSDRLSAVIGSLEHLGEVTSKELSSLDITERYIDTQARLGTKVKLRDRLQKLLDRADTVKDVLAIEKELTRLQADIDSMTARLKSMKSRVDYASLIVRLEAQKQEMVLGPLGYVWKGAAWTIEKLFVWKDESYVEQ